MKKYGFTLAEVLIVLVILGVIAVMTVPSLIGNANEAANIAALKKSLSTLNNAITLAGVQEGETIGAQENASGVVNNMMARTLKIADNKAPNFSTADGMAFSIVFDDTPSKCTNMSEGATAAQACGLISVDVNGPKGPNARTQSSQKGQIKDQFVFLLFNDGVIPAPSTPEAVIISSGATKTNLADTAATAGTTWAAYDSEGKLTTTGGYEKG